METSYGEDLYRQIFDLDGEFQNRQSSDASSAIEGYAVPVMVGVIDGFR